MSKNILKMLQKGFTLIELLIVVAILAIVTTITIIIINPAELTAQGRDGTRFSDMDSIRTAINSYLFDKGCREAETPPVAPWHSSFQTNTYVSTTGTTAGVPDTPATPNKARGVTGTGWIPINFTELSTGSPFAAIPVDPINSTTRRYEFKTGPNCVYELNAIDIESKKFDPDTPGGTDDKGLNTNDGGNNGDKYEVGTDPGLDLLD